MTVFKYYKYSGSIIRTLHNRLATLKWIILGVKMDKCLSIERNVFINNHKKVTLGKNSHIRYNSIITTENYSTGSLTIVDNCDIN